MDSEDKKSHEYSKAFKQMMGSYYLYCIYDSDGVCIICDKKPGENMNEKAINQYIGGKIDEIGNGTQFQQDSRPPDSEVNI